MGQQESGQGDGLANSEKNLAHLDKLKEALDSSSDKNRNFLIVFLLLEFYIFIAVLGTTDLNLFLASSFYTFPFIQFQISLEQFYLVAPFLLLAFHFNLVFNFLEHCKILRAWSDEINRVGEKRAEQLSLLRAFIINTRAKYDRAFDVNGNGNVEVKAKQKRKADYLVLNSIFVSFVFVFPLALQVFILWKFAAFQSILYTGLHFFTVGLSIGLLCWYWPGIQNPNLIELEGQAQASKVQRTLSNKTSYQWLFGWIFLAFVFASVRAYYTWQYYKATDEEPKAFVSWVEPTLTIEDKDIKVLANNAIERTIESAKYINAKAELTTAKIDFTEILHCKNNEQYQEIVLKERSFKGINLKEVVICNVSLKGAKLHFAKINESTFSGRFDEASLNYANLTDVNLQLNSSFEGGDFVGVTAQKLNANQIGFIAVNFSNTKFFDSEFNQSRFIAGDLDKVQFANSRLYGANFEQAEAFNASESLQTAMFDGCKLTDTAITNAKVNFDSCEVVVTENSREAMQIAKHNSELVNQKIDHKNKSEKPEQTVNEQSDDTQKVTSYPQEVLDRISAARLNNSTTIVLRGFNLTQLPSELLALKQFKKVFLGNNKLDHKQMRLLINAMPNVEMLDWENNQLIQMPSEIVKLTQLKTIGLKDNRLDQMQLSLIANSMPNLKTLWFDGNQLTQIPSEITKLKSLTEFTISENPLKQPIKQIELLSSLTELRALRLSVLSLDNLPQNFSQLTKLEWLNLNNNNFSEVPQVVWQLANLRNLYLNGNKLEQLPADISSLKELNLLKLDSNQLTTLPRELASLSITWLEAKGNQLTSPPQAIADAASGDGNFNKLKQWFAENPENPDK